MKKVLILLLLGILAFDVDAQLMFNTKTSSKGLTGISASDEFSSMLAKKRKKRKSIKRKSMGKKRGSSSAGSGLNLGGGLAVGLPMSDFGKGYNTGFGLNIEGEYLVMPEISVGISTGYLTFKYKKDVLGGSGNFNMVPIMLNGKYYLMTDNVKPYVGLGLGLFIDKSKYEYNFPAFYDNPVSGEIETLQIKNKTSNSSTDFGIAPTVGTVFSMSDNLSFNVGARFNMFFFKDDLDKSHTYSFIGFNVGILYTLGL